MDVFIDLFAKLQYGIALLAVLWLLVLWLRPKVRALRRLLTAKAIAATKSVSDASRSVSSRLESLPSVNAE